MTYISYIDRKFQGKSLDLIQKANEIIEDYRQQGYQLTLRQLFYQFITINYFPNTEQSYNRLGEIISDARLAGLVSWEAIEDKTRSIKIRPRWGDADTFLKSVIPQFHMNMWSNQPSYVEVWVEKDALIGVIERPCKKLDVPHMACRGYMSQSEEWAAANRFEEASANGQEPILIYLGDHDPSGVDMSRDHTDRLTLFLNHVGVDIDVRRIALNIDQVHQYNPPPNPTKVTDSRSKPYIQKFGKTCWELDAMKPQVIDKWITDEITRHIDSDLWTERADEIKEQRDKLNSLVDMSGEQDRYNGDDED